MLPRKARVPKEEIDLFPARPLARSPYFLLFVRPNGFSYSRFVIVVGAKTDKRAARRHTLKRRVVGLIQTKDRGGQDIKIIILPPANGLPRQEFYKELNKLINVNPFL